MDSRDGGEFRTGWVRILSSLLSGSLFAAACSVFMFFIALILHYTFWPEIAVIAALLLSALLPLWVFVRNALAFGTNRFYPPVILKHRTISTIIYVFIFLLLFFFLRSFLFWYLGTLFNGADEQPRLLPKNTPRQVLLIEPETICGLSSK